MQAVRLIRELVVLYELEPTIRDVFVEGPTDRGVVKAFLYSNGRRDVGVHTIDSIHIEVGDLGPGLLDNTRSRVIHLAAQLEALSHVDLTRRVACIADTDRDDILNAKRCHALLIYTDYTSLELYAFNESTVQKFIDIIWLGGPRPAGDVLHMIAEPLRALFAVRVAAEELSLGIKWLSPSKLLSVEGDSVQIDLAEFLKRYLNQGVPRETRETAIQRVSDWQGLLPADHRHCIHGDDFLEVLVWTLRELRSPRVSADEMFIRRTLLASIELTRLSSEGMFVELLARLPSLAGSSAAAA